MTITSEAVTTAGHYRVEVAHGVGDIDQEAWNAVAIGGGGSVFHSWEWLAAFEQAPPGEFEPMHLIVHSGEQVVAICPAYLVHRCPRLDYLKSLSGFSPDGPILLAHSLAALAGGPVVLPGHAMAVDAVVAGLDRAAADVGAWAWGFANLPSGPLVGRLLGAGHAAAQITTAYRLDSDFRSQDEYWQSIPGKRRRKLARERRVRGDSLSIVETSPDIDTLVRLIHALLVDRNTPIDVLPERFLRALCDRLERYERSVVAKNAVGETVAAFAGWQFGGEWSLWLAGLDVDRLASFEPYHPMFAHVIESAIDTGTGVVNFGRANGRQKRRYATVGVPLYLTLHSPDRRRNALLHAACLDIETQRTLGAADGLEIVRRCC